jgi:hypothetical protein
MGGRRNILDLTGALRSCPDPLAWWQLKKAILLPEALME